MLVEERSVEFCYRKVQKPIHRRQFQNAASSEEAAAREVQHDADISLNIAVTVGGGLITGGIVAVATTPAIVAATIATGGGIVVVIGGLLVARLLRRRQIAHEIKRRNYEQIAEDLR